MCDKCKECEAYVKFFNEAPVGLYKTNQKDGTFLIINPFGAKLLGYDSPKDVVGKVKSTDLYDLAVRDELLRKLHSHPKHIVSDFEICVTGKNGKEIWVSLTAQNGGDSLFGSFADITPRKLLEEELRVYRENAAVTLSKVTRDAKRRLAKYDVG